MKSLKISLCLFVLILITLGNRSLSNIINGEVQFTKENITMNLHKKDRNIDNKKENNKSIKFNSKLNNSITNQKIINPNDITKYEKEIIYKIDKGNSSYFYPFFFDFLSIFINIFQLIYSSYT